MASLHRYLVARYQIEDYDDYIHLLALYRNTRGVQAQNSHSRYDELFETIRAIDSSRLALLHRLQQRHQEYLPGPSNRPA